jgi:hypothetical protein
VSAGTRRNLRREEIERLREREGFLVMDVRGLLEASCILPLVIFSSYEGISGFPDVTKYGKEKAAE